VVTKADNNRAMEEALQAAIARMNSGAPSLPGSGASAGPALDPIPLLMSVLPKLLERGSDDNDTSEQLASLQKELLQPLREQLARQNQLLERLFNAQKAVLRKLSALETVQSAIGGAVTSLTEQMARIELVDDEQFDAPDLGRHGHSHSRLDFADLGMSYPRSSDDPRRRPRRG
jgi:uncharacterized protein YhaN